MADEIKLSIALSYAKAGRSASTRGMGLEALEIDVAGTDFIGPFTQIVTTTAVALEAGGTTATGYVVIKNIEATNTSNYILVRNGATGADVIRLNNGEAAVFRAAASTIFLDVDANSCEALILVIEA